MELEMEGRRKWVAARTVSECRIWHGQRMREHSCVHSACASCCLVRYAGKMRMKFRDLDFTGCVYLIFCTHGSLVQSQSLSVLIRDMIVIPFRFVALFEVILRCD